LIDLEIKKRITSVNIEDMQPTINSEGVTLCLNCNKPIPKTNRKYCSQECSSQFYAKHNQAGLRDYVYKRENGKCQKCGWVNPKGPDHPLTIGFGKPRPERPGWFEGENGASLHRKAVIAYHKALKLWDIEFEQWLKTDECRKAREVNEKKEAEFYKEIQVWRKSLRDFIADHIVPIALGGPEFDLDNIQLLCDKCNKIKTAKDAADIAKRRKMIKRLGKKYTQLTEFSHGHVLLGKSSPGVIA